MGGGTWRGSAWAASGIKEEEQGLPGGPRFPIHSVMGSL